MQDTDVIVPDYRKSLPVLRSEWETCTRCDLGERRNTVGGQFVFGEGTPGGIMFIGEGPGVDEEANGRPFVGKSGKILRHAINRLGIDRYYITNVVTCRSCAQAYTPEGQPKYKKNWKTGVMEPRIIDQPPTPAQMHACLPRLYEEIYLVDPKIIVALGVSSAEVLARRPVTIQRESGTTIAISIPGAGRKPTVTDKKKVWARTVRGALIAPHVPNNVEYLMIPLLHPAFVARKQKDERWMNPVQMFAEGMKKIVAVYDRYMFEVYGDQPGAVRELAESDIHEAMMEEEDE
jgi:uracil-DNA glycosylase